MHDPLTDEPSASVPHTMLHNACVLAPSLYPADRQCTAAVGKRLMLSQSKLNTLLLTVWPLVLAPVHEA